MDQDNILQKVTLLGILKKEPSESLDDVMTMLVDTGMYDKAEAKQIFAQLRESGHIAGESLSIIGMNIAKKAEQEFKQ